MPDIHIEDLIIPKFDDALFDILDHGHTHYVFPGGRGGSKSSFIGTALPLLITQHPTVHGAVFRRYANTLRDSVYAQVNAGISNLGMSALFKPTVSPMEITYRETGQKIMFRGLDEPEKIKSIKVPFGYIGLTWFEELDQFPGRQALRNVLQSTMRGGDLFWNFESFNPPITNANWVNEDVKKDRKSRLVTWSNYLDVPPAWLGEQFFEEAEELRLINEKAYRHEYLGEVVGTGGMVFENARDETITDAQIAGFDRLYNGLDWGWFPDPWAFNRMHYNAQQRILYIFDEARGNKLPNETTIGIVKSKILPGEQVTCDNQEQKSINEYQAAGIKAVSAEKGPGSVEYSHKWLQSLNAIIIDRKRCPATWKEFSEYEYDRARDGSIMTGYPDKNNHHIDAVRYALERVWMRRKARTPGFSLPI